MSSDDNDDDEILLIGNEANCWRYSMRNGFDLTREKDHRTSKILHLETRTSSIVIDCNRSALIIIDMQNFFLNPSLRSHSNGLMASTQLLNFAIPAARQGGIQIIWLNWGLTDEDIDQAPPGLQRIFQSDFIEDFRRRKCEKSSNETKSKRIYRGFGCEMGEILLSDGRSIDAGRMLMQNTWNSQLYDSLFQSYQISQTTSKPDRCFHKNRISGLWNDQSPLIEYLRDNKMTTLFFAGVNTDQCVSGTMQDAFSKGFDCILLSDGCGTTSPSFAQQSIEYNWTRGLGFLTTCQSFAQSIQKSLL